VAGIFAAALAGSAQPRATTSLVALLAGSTSGDSYLGERLPWLADLGYVEGRDVRFEFRSPLPGQEAQLPQMARELVRFGPRVLIVEGMPAIRAARDATGTVPIVMVAAGDPVKAGFVKSLARPGGNVTGVATLFHELTAKRLELLREVAPGTRRVGVLWNPAKPDVADQWAQARAAAQALGLEARSLEVRRVEDVESALDLGRRDGIGAVLVTLDTVTWSGARRIMDLAAARRLPAMYTSRLFVDYFGHGGLMAFAPDRIHVSRLVTRYVDRILKGAKPADLPVEHPTEFELVVNARAARAMGLTFPPSILARADRVIE
jgi:putative ABC transport system substrate-binding protein